jgi:polysaccharide biosynthesis transport protein
LSDNETTQPQSDTSVSCATLFEDHQSSHGSGLQRFMRLLAKRWKWIVGPVAICEILAVILTLNTKPIYDATATIRLEDSSNGSQNFGLGLSQQLGGDSGGPNTAQKTEAAILQSDSLALAVIQRLKLDSQPPFITGQGKNRKLNSEKGLPLENAPFTRTHLLKIFKSNLFVDLVSETSLIKVTYQSHDPKQAAQIANALIDCYKIQYLQTHYEATSEASVWLTKQLSELKNNVQDSQNKLTQYEKENNIISLDATPSGAGSATAGSGNTGGGSIHSVVIEKLDALNTELTAAEADRIEKEAIYRLVKTNNSDVILALKNDPLATKSNSMVLNQGGGTSNLQQLRQQQNALKISIATASHIYGENNRHLKDLQTQLHELNDQIHQEMQEIVNRAQADLKLAQQTENEIRRQFNEQQAEASKLNEKTVQFAVLSQEASSREKLYEDLYTKLQEANLSANVQSTNITVVDPARSQSVPVRPKSKLNLEMGLLSGIVLGFAIAYTLDSLDQTINDPVDIEEITGKPVIGVIPEFSETSMAYGKQLMRKALWHKNEHKKTQDIPSRLSSIWILDHPQSYAAEAIRGLRTAIMLSQGGGGPKTILMTSCVSGEGKTTLTTNLGVAYAQHNKKVLLIEADMRRPRMLNKEDYSSKMGLSTVLSGFSTNAETIIRGVHVPTLDILPAGPNPPMPSELIGSTAFDELLKQLRAQYDVILIDSSPSLLVTDAVLISQKVDATIWVSEIGFITRPQLSRAIRLIEQNRMPVIGFVANRMSSGNSEYGYGYGYGDRSHYGEKDSHDA